ncbi:MAG: endopeptidase La [Candidatus Aquicultor secundus]|uniref:endopeptidase La n=1 Tax=Candidatus Aquicultor secundus TaxID=1973895 RepID=UPI000CB8C647|nr:endopeptidase La [Candidatus Aquicultor secundus]PIU26658.1 MAG: endopeptidase La [Candidatus Aquicultor secundus]PIW21862.1 MAG: endopeptidase La [Candidatus Aquicultor secundus]PIX52196.1 MAG: endopeptidase La [Candidatus Aquicultor secundus]
MHELDKEEIVIPEEIALIPLRDMIIFPNLVVPLFVGREKSIAALEVAMKEEHIVALVTQKMTELQEPDIEDLYGIGTAAVIMQELKIPDGTAKALVEGLSRIEIVEFTQTEPYFRVKVKVLPEQEDKDIEVEALMRNLVLQFERAASLGKPIPQEVLLATSNIEEPGRLADFIAFHLNLKIDEKQQIIEAVNAHDRLEKVSIFLNRELEILEIGSKIQSRVKDQLTKTQKEYFLKEQLKAIQQELGLMDEQAAEMEELRAKIKAAKMPKEVNEKTLKELDRLARMSPQSAESSVIRTYLDWLIGLPWQKKSKQKLNLKEASTILDEDHYGLEQVKKRVLEYLAVHQLTNKMRGTILCFVGPPGTGKTSIGKSIARSLGRKFVRISLGGVHDEAEIRGHRRTYVGALPGRIIQAINQSGTNNPVFMLDEIDKVGADFRGDPTAALLEVLDPEQNFAFSDHYLEVPFDLSDVVFITTANMLETIPAALRDRMEIIPYSGYTEEEKVQIATKYLIPKQVGEHGLKDKNILIEDKALREVIREYTREAGVRGLERRIASICRQIARKVVEGEKKRLKITEKNLHEYLGPRQFSYGLAEEADEIGVATGLAWTEFGGDVLSVEAATLSGRGKLMLTGQLGEVMRESAQAAVSYIRSRAEMLKIDKNFYSEFDIHIHVPAGGIPKDGPSAGITIATALASELTKRPAKREVAMTGEITLRGRVLPIGGVKEKVLSAHRAGIKEIILPAENEKDLELVPKEVKEELKFFFVKHMDEVLELALRAKSKNGPKSAKAAKKQVSALSAN